jgi:hypothetical protein
MAPAGSELKQTTTEAKAISSVARGMNGGRGIMGDLPGGDLRISVSGVAKSVSGDGAAIG